jgi:hypothetical protein
MKVTHAKSVLKTSVVARAGILLKPRAPSGTAVLKTPVTVTASRARVLKISTGTKRYCSVARGERKTSES